MRYLEIEKVIGRDYRLRGNPTAEAEVWLADGPIIGGFSGASTGEFEAPERAIDKSRFSCKRSRKAEWRTSTPPSTRRSGWMPPAVDAMLQADGTKISLNLYKPCLAVPRRRGTRWIF